MASNGVRGYLAGAAFALIALASPLASAQFSLFDSDVSITADPSRPSPGAQVRLVAESSFLNLTTAKITWTVDGKTVQDGVGEKEIVVTAPSAGKEMNVSVRVSALGESANGSLTLIPGTVDLLFDATSYTPPFYRGRALPSPGAVLRFVAVPHISSRSGPVAASELIYTWRQDGEVLGSISGRGRSSAIIGAPPLFGASDISVEVRTADGISGAEVSVRIPAIDPQVTLYLNHPLFGVEYYRAVRDRDVLSDLEATFSAVPYFIAAASPSDRSLRYDWSVNGTPLSASSSAANEITINAVGASGPATISLGLSSPQNFYLDARHSWTISFAGGNAGTNIPRSSVAPADAFHTNAN